jgi:hypothetical protein
MRLTYVALKMINQVDTRVRETDDRAESADIF